MARGCPENKRCTDNTDQRIDGTPPGDIRESGLDIADYGSDECDDPTELRHISIYPYQAHSMQGGSTKAMETVMRAKVSPTMLPVSNRAIVRGVDRSRSRVEVEVEVKGVENGVVI